MKTYDFRHSHDDFPIEALGFDIATRVSLWTHRVSDCKLAEVVGRVAPGVVECTSIHIERCLRTAQSDGNDEDANKDGDYDDDDDDDDDADGDDGDANDDGDGQLHMWSLKITRISYN